LADQQDPFELYERGHLAAAITRAQRVGTADAYALAARASLAAAVAAPESVDLEALSEDAQGYAAKALDVNGDHLEGHLQTVAALGLRARLADPVAAHLRGYGARMQDHLKTALKIEPKSAWAHVLAGKWHVELVLRGGEQLADSLYDADLDAGIRLLREAYQLAPDDPDLVFQIGRALAKLDATGEEGRAMMKAAADLEAHNAFEAAIIAWARAGGNGQPTRGTSAFCDLPRLIS
jgi:tetratricopeptide (TPR) repeat protein